MSEMVEFIEHPKPPALANSWPSGLAIEVGLNSLCVGAAIASDEDLCRQFEITQGQLERYKMHPAFLAEVREAIAAIKDSNATLKRKAKMSLEYYADTYVPQWLADPSASVDSKTKLLGFLYKLGGLEAEDKSAEKAQQNQQVTNVPSINITLTTAAPVQAVPTLERVVSG